MVDFKALTETLYVAATSYSTRRVACIRSWKIALTFRLFQLLLFGYLICWSIVYKKGYQSYDRVSGAITTKVKGQGYDTGKVPRIFDTADFSVIPPSEYNSVWNLKLFIRLMGVNELSLSNLQRYLLWLTLLKPNKVKEFAMRTMSK
jgi:hypothetical protein